MFAWFKASESKQLGLELANVVKDHAPANDVCNDRKRLAQINYAKEKMQKRIRQFKQTEVLNFYKTAVLLNTYKWELKDAGYDDNLAGALASWVHITLRES